MFYKKKREQKFAKKAKASEDTKDNDEGIYVGAIKIRLAIPGNPTDEYQYDTYATHHTTNEFHRLCNIKELNLEVE
jgi:hypothetical protein